MLKKIASHGIIDIGAHIHFHFCTRTQPGINKKYTAARLKFILLLYF